MQWRPVYDGVQAAVTAAESDTRVYDVHVVYSSSYSVPALFLQVYGAGVFTEQVAMLNVVQMDARWMQQRCYRL